jgi:Tfp pilus assembly pilus retraction ATPase PilT
METAAKEGMITMDKSIKDLYLEGLISYEEAKVNMRNPKELK